MSIVLASSSPRRQQFMKDLGVAYIVDAPDVDETPLKAENPMAYVKRIAREKAEVVSVRQAGEIVLASDTTVFVGRQILGKPEDEVDAARMLRMLSGKRHKVVTAVSVIDASGKHYQKTEMVVVKFKVLSKKDIQKHVANVENWSGKAGGWGIQSTAGAALTKWMQGQYSAVVGLPLVETINLLRKVGVDV